MTTSEERPRFAAFGVHSAVRTRWSDNDMYGHLNNAVYYELFDTVLNGWLAENSSDDFTEHDHQAVVLESSCRFFAEVAFPGMVTVALGVEHIGNSSVVYRMAVFEGEHPEPDALPNAVGRWVDVFIDRRTSDKVPIPDALRTAMETVRLT